MRESNSRPRITKPMFCHLTNGAIIEVSDTLFFYNDTTKMALDTWIRWCKRMFIAN